MTQGQPYLLLIMGYHILGTFLQLLPERTDVLSHKWQVDHPGRQRRKTIRLQLVYPDDRFFYMPPDSRNNINNRQRNYCDQQDRIKNSRQLTPLIKKPDKPLEQIRKRNRKDQRKCQHSKEDFQYIEQGQHQAQQQKKYQYRLNSIPGIALNIFVHKMLLAAK